MGKIQNPTASYKEGALGFGEDVYKDINRCYTEFNGNISTVNLAESAVGETKINDGSKSAGKFATSCVRYSQWAIEELSLNGIPAWLFHPNYPGSGGGLIVRSYHNINLSAGDSPKTITVNINGVDGAQTFMEIPTFLGAPIIRETAGAATVTAVRVVDRSRSNYSIEYTYTGSGYVGVYISYAGGI